MCVVPCGDHHGDVALDELPQYDMEIPEYLVTTTLSNEVDGVWVIITQEKHHITPVQKDWE